MSGRKNGTARHPSPCYIGRASAGHCSKPVNNPAGDRTVSCYLLGYRPYSFRCPADLRPVVAATSAEKNSQFETDSVRSPAGVRKDTMTSQCDQMDMDPSASQESGGEPPRKNTRLDNDYLNYSKWDADTVADKLRQKGLIETAERFRGGFLARLGLGCGCSGATKLVYEPRLGSREAKDEGFSYTEGDLVEGVVGSTVIRLESERQVFNDPIHGHIELHPLCVKILDTPEFQRLRFIKQLGTCYFVYPGASHNRFENSLGVCHLAGKLLRVIRQRQPELDITDVDVLCVEIAGLCHDLGHGPFSHLFDVAFIPTVSPGTRWNHEDTSIKTFRYLVEENQLNTTFKKYDLTDVDITFIEEMIAGPQHYCEDIWALKGRTEDKSFLYEIVANKRNGIDVDKWDYFARDCLMLGIRNNFDYTRFIHFARVVQVNGAYQICTRDKDSETLYDMFHIRQTLNRIAYSHKTSNIIQKMVTEAFVKANDHIKFVGEKGIEKKMSEAIHDMKAFSQMTDHVFNLILNSTDPNLKESRDILTNVLKRKLYKCVGQTQAKGEHMKKEVLYMLYFIIQLEDKHVMIKEMRKLMDDDEYEISPLYDMSDHGIVLLFVDLDHGMNEKNPIENTMFYCKEKPNEAFHIRREQESNFLPSLFKEQAIRVYSKAVDQRSQNIVRQAFVRWCEENKYPTPKGGYVSSGGLTRFKAGKRLTDQVKEAEQQHTRSRNNTANIKQEPDMEWNSAASCY
ncbi:deoxynucleoside triphosphate triphosphohydrolase SAMHD1-like [Mya arenaria]|uniref:deoxynucleoside triphosphate triphosphohydrolase SAMHD1-like n=1 Tax=Mya arenaria TaxID=6604 RepID=UPI0022E50E01|nr:deoxynucleoside triphosphate triphosphohydrolase SAMHD1-like [Mya arenaria]